MYPHVVLTFSLFTHSPIIIAHWWSRWSVLWICCLGVWDRSCRRHHRSLISIVHLSSLRSCFLHDLYPHRCARHLFRSVHLWFIVGALVICIHRVLFVKVFTLPVFSFSSLLLSVSVVVLMNSLPLFVRVIVLVLSLPLGHLTSDDDVVLEWHVPLSFPRCGDFHRNCHGSSSSSPQFAGKSNDKIQQQPLSTTQSPSHHHMNSSTSFPSPLSSYYVLSLRYYCITSSQVKSIYGSTYRYYLYYLMKMYEQQRKKERTIDDVSCTATS